jgi:hypothetical protein
MISSTILADLTMRLMVESAEWMMSSTTWPE